MNRIQALQLIQDEYRRATGIFGPFQSQLEGYGILTEEMHELLHAIMDNPLGPHEADKAVRDEAIHVAAMALRFLIDCC